jgi:hypothetical protein
MSDDALACSIRKPLEETVGLSQEQAAAIEARILGRLVYIANITRLQPPGTGEVYRVATTDGEQFLLKGYRPQPGFSEQTRGKCVCIESQNLGNINDITAFRHPKYIGREGAFFLQEWVEGRLLGGTSPRRQHARESGDHQNGVDRAALLL